MDVLQEAKRYLNAGISLIPVRADGSKAPALTAGEVEKYRERLPTVEELEVWFAPNRAVGIAILGGKINGNLAVLDFESAATWETWQKRAEGTEIEKILADCPLVQTPKGGRHLYVRIADTFVSGKKLACRASDKETLIETRAQGQYVLAPGCPLACHETNRPYTLLRAGWLHGAKQDPIPKAVWDQACDFAREQNEWVPPERTRHAAQGESNAKGNRPGDEFNRRASWHDVLEPHGWRICRASGSVVLWTRPGKDPRIGCSATTGKCHTEGRGDLLYVFSSNAHPFESEVAYSKFAAYAELNHGGDYTAASRDLAKQGYSTDSPAEAFSSESWAQPEAAEGPKKVPDDGIAPDPDFATNKDFEAFDLSVRWVWDKWLQLGTVNLLAAEGGMGKTRFIADLCRRSAHRLPWPDGTTSMEWSGNYLAMWVAGDRNHAELVDLSRKFGFYDRIAYSGSRKDPFGGITLNSVADFMALYKKAKAARPMFLVIDTAGGSTSFNMSKQEEARNFFAPLSDIATRLNLCVIVITHLNASKAVLGKRAEERVRTVMRMSATNRDPETVRRLEIVKSNSLYPSPIGMKLGEEGNEYDTENVPAGPEDGTGQEVDNDSPDRGPPSKVRDCMDWLELELADRPKRVFEIRKMADSAGFASGTLYRAVSALNIMETEMQGYKWWGLRKDA